MTFQGPGFTKSLKMLMIPFIWFVLIISNAAATETVVYSEGFESSNGGYTHTGVLDKWERGVPSSGFTLGPVAAHSGNKCWGTDLDDTVPFGSNAYLTSSAITLPSIDANQLIRVRFFGWIAVDFMADRGQFQVSSDGVNWETKADLLLTMQGGWNEYVFDISDYAGDVIYLRFRCTTDNENNFDPPTIPYNMAGFYVDDIAIIMTDAPAIKKILTLEANENQSSTASCPWIYVKGKNGKFQKENDVYSTARGSGSEYTDYYQLNKKLIANDSGKLVFKLKETEQEESFTDFLSLIVVDHAANVDVATDENGNVFTYKDKKDPLHPSSAVDNNGANVLPMISDADEIGCKVYHGDYIDLDFSSIENVQHPIFLLRAQGFLVDTLPGSPIPAQPSIQVQTQNAGGEWITRNVFYPRWKSAFSGYDMAGLFPYAKKIRLVSVSCLTGKYHLIDWAAISTANQKPITITELSPLSAIRSDGNDVTDKISTINQHYARMTTGEEIKLKFEEPPIPPDTKRDFIIKTRGYYVPNGTYFIYTWDGSKWVQRDGWSIPTADDETREFDLSLWLPDPDGKNRVRIWQDFFFDPAAVDYIGLKRDNVDLTMSSATDLRYDNSVLDLVNVSDNNRLLWDWGEDWPYRDRWVEIEWADDFVNTPPSTNPVFVTNSTINWTYFDLNGNPQSQYEIEVWSGPNGTGYNFWDPPVGYGTVTSDTYNGLPLESEQQYYARVKAFDGQSWGTWSEAAFTAGSNNPPVAEAGPDTTVAASPSCITSVALDGSASTDPDGDNLSFLWTGPFGTVTGPQPAVFLNPGTFVIKLVVSDGKGGTGMDSVTITVQDTTAPAPDAESLPQITGECSATIAAPPTATDNCAGNVTGTTTDPLSYSVQGSHIVTWTYSDGNGNVATQTQTVIVNDNVAPVPNVPQLPTITGSCSATITAPPTATDNCAGNVTGTTTDPLSYAVQGSYIVTWTYDDGNGNVATQTQTVVVDDNVAPVPDTSQLPTITGSCSATIAALPTATDNCAGTLTGTTTDPLTYSVQGTYSVTWTYSDGNGNVATQTQAVVVNDNVAPVPNVPQLPTITGSCSATIAAPPTATDNCAGNVTGTTTDPLSYSVQGTYSVTWTYSDGNGNVATQTQAVVVDDNVAPVPDVAQMPTITGSCTATITAPPTATDNCAGSVTGTTTDPLIYSTPGTYSVTWRYFDGYGNTSTQSQSVVVLSGACCTSPTDSAYNYGILARNITWSGSGSCNTGHSAIQANGSYSMTGSSTVIGNIYSTVRISRTGSSTINGNASAPVISQTGSGRITGIITIGQVAQVAVPTIDMTPYYDWALAHGTVHNGNVHLSGSRDTVIPGGVLWVNGNFRLSGSMRFTGCVIATGSVDISGSGDFTKVNNTPVIASINGNITLSGSGRITGLIFAQNGGITKSGSGNVTGSLICKGDLTKSGSWSTLTYTKFLPMPPECD